MPSLANSGGEGHLSLVSEVSQPPDDDFSERTPQPPPEGSVNHVSRSGTPTRDERDDLALVLRLSQLSSNEFDEQLAQLPRMGSAPAAEKFTPNEKQTSESNHQKELSRSEDSPASLPTATPLVQDDTQGSLGGTQTSGLSNDAGLALHDDYSGVLALAQRGTSSLRRYLSSGMVAELEEAINALRIAQGSLPENHPMHVGCVSNLGTSFQLLFERLGDLATLDEAITTQEKAVRLTPAGDPDKHMYLNNLGNSFLRRFERLGDIANVDEAITVQQQAVLLALDGHPNKPMYLNNLGNSFQSRFECRGDVADIDEAITAQQQAVCLTPDVHPDKPTYLDSLGNSFLRQFEHLGDIAKLDKAVTAHQEAVQLTPDGDPDQPGRLNNLGISYFRRVERLGSIADLDKAIAAQQRAVHLTPDNHPHKPGNLNNLGNSFLHRFGRLGDIADLDKAITAQQRAVRLTPDDHPDKLMYLNNLGNSFQNRIERLGHTANVDEAITAQQQAVRLTPDNHPQKLACLNNLANSFQSRFERFGDIADVDEAIAVQREVVRLTPDCHTDKPGRLNNLGNSFLRRFERLSDIGDVDEAIKAQRQAVCLAPDEHPQKPICLNNLGNSLRSRFERLGDIADVDKSITAQQQATRLTPDGHPDKPRVLNNLGNSFLRRFERLGDIVDVGAAITAQQHAVLLTADDHPQKPACLNCLGNSFFRRFERLGNTADADEAITAHQQAVRFVPDHPHKPVYLNNLGNTFLHRFERLGDVADVVEAITVQQQAVNLTADDHPHKPMYLTHLGNSFLHRFKRLGDVADADRAITAQQQAIHLTPDGHSHKPARLNNLGTSFRCRFAHHPDEATFAQAISIYSQSARSSSGPPSERFTAAHIWATLCFSAHSKETLEAYSTLIDLLPRVVWLGRTIEQRYKDISAIGDAVADAAAAAIHFGKFDLALEWLEQGRSIVWGQMLQLRSPLDELRRRHPNEADELEKISRALDSAGVTYLDLSANDASQSLEEAAQAHRRLAEEHDRILENIRNFPDFNEFLRPEKSSSLCRAAISGPVVVLNAHKTRCDALILRPHSSEISHVPLPGFQISVAQEMRLQLAGLMRGANATQRHYAPDVEVGMELSDILGRIWSHVVEPILSCLNLLRKPTGCNMPHMTWCLTGPFAFLPIHAAGLYDAHDQPKIFDYVISSYTPTVAALLSTTRRPPKSIQAPRLLTVSQLATPGQNTLPGTVVEVDAIQSQTDRLHITRLDGQEATVAAVVHHMKECSWIHLACHGVQDAANPIDSAFLLVDKPLTLKEIMKQSFTHTELAMLSACQTAKGDSELPDEAIHLAAGMLMAGYKNVVATMWSIRDDDAPIIVERFYEHLIREAGGDSSRAPYALHDAVAHLRDLRGEKNFASWVPFIHLGICSPLPE